MLVFLASFMMMREKRSAINYANSMLVYGFGGSVGLSEKNGKPQTPRKKIWFMAWRKRSSYKQVGNHDSLWLLKKSSVRWGNRKATNSLENSMDYGFLKETKL